jgi:hypothetical protein
MKYIKTFESHRTSKNTETVNEEFLGAIGKFFGNMFKKAKERINKTKGGQEVEAIYQKYLDLISKEFAKTAKVELNLAAAARENEGTAAVPKKESLNLEDSNVINEADDAPAAEGDAPAAEGEAPAAPEVDAKTAVAQLKSKKTVLDQIIKKLKEMALKEMDTVLKKYGGAAANPQLEIIITAKKDQFDLDFMNAQISWLEKAGDKTESIAISKQRDVIAKKIEADYKDFDSKKAVAYKEGDNVIYLLQGKTKEEWTKLTDDEKKKPTEGNAAKIVGVHKISKIDGDKFTLLDKDDKPTIQKTGAEIVGKLGAGFGYSVGDRVKYKMNDGGEAETVITKIEGDNWFFKGKDKELKKPFESIISKVKKGEEAKPEEAKTEGEETKTEGEETKTEGEETKTEETK